MMEPTNHTTRSCVTCAKAKAKCVWDQERTERTCQRCTRLGKECLRKEAVARRRKPEKSTRAAQLQKLENKLDHLVNALSSSTSQLQAASTSASSTPLLSTATPQTAASTRSNGLGHPSPAISQLDNPANTTHRDYSVLDTMCGGDNLEFNREPDTPKHPEAVAISLVEAEVLLDRYKKLMACYMPFVVIPRHATPQSLYESNPLLLRAIVCVALFHDLPRQRVCVKDLIREIGERILVKGERSVDLLQCVMVTVAWYHPHVFWFNQLTMLLHLAVALTVDTCVDRAPQKNEVIRKSSERVQTLADHRVLMGVFYYTSIMATNFGNRTSALHFTPYMDECLSVIDAAREYASDLHLVQTVRVQRLACTIVSNGTSHVPAKVYASAIRADIERLREIGGSPQQQTKLRADVPLQLQCLAVELHAWEASLANLFDNHTKILTHHLEDVYGCTNAIQSIFDLFLAIPTGDFFFVTFSIFDHFVYALICFTKLSLMEAEPWIRTALNDKMRFSETFEAFAAKFEAADASQPDDIKVENDCFGAWGKKLRFARQVWEAKMAHSTRAASPVRDADGHGDRLSNTLNEMGQPTPAESMDDAEFFNYLNGSFWDNFAGDFDLGAVGLDTFG
ncbi:unnamed protein product [Zymoseptoria tritici ST99CH_3D7]|uniref:Zn(2)-C6 fungal-type domain-containing protein n=1 Tax=Zymoseptoria tritici (strain ST99CH_3D7) TaxID=1276538 RepID=A0A1X7RSL5_ZYMT9|nr:unnamed protein product [Zymoseptoria tritici ST99CH_3D7]